MLGVSPNYSTSYHAQTDGLAERTVQTLVDLIRRYCNFGLLYTDEEGYRHDWVSLLLALEMAYNSTTHSVTGRTPFELEKGWNPFTPMQLMQGLNLGELPTDPGADSFSRMIEMAREHAAECIDSAFDDAKRRWDEHHAPPKIAVQDQVLLSTKHFNIMGSRKLKDPWVGPFVVTEMVGSNAVRLLLTPPYDRKHPVFPISLLKLVKSAEAGTPADRRQLTRRAPPVIDDEGEPLYHPEKILDSRNEKINGERVRQYLVKWKDYPEEESTWENEAFIREQGYTQFIRSYRAAARDENRD